MGHSGSRAVQAGTLILLYIIQDLLTSKNPLSLHAANLGLFFLFPNLRGSFTGETGDQIGGRGEGGRETLLSV